MEDFCKRWQAVFFIFDALKTANISIVAIIYYESTLKYKVNIKFVI